MKLFFTSLFLVLVTVLGSAQNLPVGWDELTSPDFVKAVEKSEGVCIIPMGILEKQGPHLPLGTDIYMSRDVSLMAAKKEYCIVFPQYYVGQIYEAKHQPGTIAYSSDLIYTMLEETCEEIARNGIKKIILVNSHGGNNAFLQYFCQLQLSKEKDYVVYFFRSLVDSNAQPVAALRKSELTGHADEARASYMMVTHPELVKIETANDESGAPKDGLTLQGAFTGIWWYSKYPNHYSGDAKHANEELGNVVVEQLVQPLVELIKAVKADKMSIELQNQFYKESQDPLKTLAK